MVNLGPRMVSQWIEAKELPPIYLVSLWEWYSMIWNILLICINLRIKCHIEIEEGCWDFVKGNCLKKMQWNVNGTSVSW